MKIGIISKEAFETKFKDGLKYHVLKEIDIPKYVIEKDTWMVEYKEFLATKKQGKEKVLQTDGSYKEVNTSIVLLDSLRKKDFITISSEEANEFFTKNKKSIDYKKNFTKQFLDFIISAFLVDAKTKENKSNKKGWYSTAKWEIVKF